MENSWEVLKRAIDKKGIKQLASDLKLSQPLLYKWCQKPVDEDDESASGAINPLDRVRMLYDKTQDPEIVNWICECAGGFMIKNPGAHGSENFIQDMHNIIKEFSDLLEAATDSVKDRKITDEEAKKIRKEWEQLKKHGESMVVSCEKKIYDL
jgi:hypothetical protein